MAHDIFGKRFIGNRGLSAWHELGTVIDEPDISVEEALIRAGISYQYFDAPLGATLPDGTFLHLESRKAVFREATADEGVAFLGVVSDEYQYLQNYDLARGLDALRTKTGWKFETAGALGEGAEVFMTLRTGERTVFGDRYDTFVAANDGKASGKALTLAITPVREVCRNTVLAAESAATLLIKLAHDRNVADEYGFWLSYIEQLSRAQDGVFETMEQMARTKVDDDQARELIAQVYPLPRKNAKLQAAEQLTALPGAEEAADERLGDTLARELYLFNYYTNHAQVRQGAAFELFEKFNAGQEYGVTAKLGKMGAKTLKDVKDSVYGVLQATTELADWGGIQRGPTAARSSLFGESAAIKRKAWAVCERAAR